jgi:iron complex outermembrane receptor protein
MKGLGLALLSLYISASPAAAQEPLIAPDQPQQPLAPDLKRLTIEELLEIDVTSVSKRIERLSQSAAAVSVLRSEDIRRSGAATLADAMRLADGLDVSRSSGRTWSITARGFASETANKLLVLMDGRTLYSPLFSGTFWDVQDTVLSDIDRIEVIRGPGGALWGANAVNGVINIITADATRTFGDHAVLGAGTSYPFVATARHGARMGARGGYRVYGKFRQTADNVLANGRDAEDSFGLGLLGFRMDTDPEAASRWTLHGRAYAGSEDFQEAVDGKVRGGDLHGTFRHRFSSAAELQVRSYYDNTYRFMPGFGREDRHTVDVDVQHHFRLGRRHDLVAGGQYRVSTARALGENGIVFDPERRVNTIGGIFAQDEITLPNSLFAILGAKAEANDYTGFELQPTLRLRWSPDDRHTVWGGVSRALRLPTRLDTDFRRVDPVTGAPMMAGNSEFESESVIAYEAGYRIRPHGRIALDLATFANRYNDLRSVETSVGAGTPAVFGNTLEAFTSGLEVSSTVQLLPSWRLHGSYSYLHETVSRDPGSRHLGPGDGSNDPGYILKLRSYIDLPRQWQLDGLWYRVDNRPDPFVPAFSALDLRLGWTFRPGMELSIIGQHLLDPRHPEFGLPAIRSEIERGVHIRASWFF